jgi:hypothetical protein
MAIILPIPKGLTRWRGNLKGLSYERGWFKSVDNLGASPLREIYQMIPLSAKQILLDGPFKIYIYDFLRHLKICFEITSVKMLIDKANYMYYDVHVQLIYIRQLGLKSTSLPDFRLIGVFSESLFWQD